MKGLKKIIAGIGAFALALSMASCFPGSSSDSNKGSNQQSKDVTSSKANDNEVIKDGIFVNDTLYNVNGQCTLSANEELGLDEDYTINYSRKYKFNNDGTLLVTDLGTSEELSFEYEITANIIRYYNQTNEYFLDYYEDVIVQPVTFMGVTVTYFTGVKNGVVVSERGTGILGYHFEINVNKGDLPAVFNGKKTATSSYPASKGLTYKIYKNGKIPSNSKGISTIYTGLNSDQIITEFDSSKVGNFIIDVVLNKTTYKAVLHVTE